MLTSSRSRTRALARTLAWPDSTTTRLTCGALPDLAWYIATSASDSDPVAVPPVQPTMPMLALTV